MGKPNYMKNEVVRVQRLRGGSIELVGKFAGDIVNIVEEACLVDLRQVGHHTLKVTGGEVQEIVQRELPLTTKKSTKASVVEELMADIAPPEHEQELFVNMVCKKQVQSAMYDEDTGRYKMLLVPLTGGKGKSYTLSFISCQVRELVPGDDVGRKSGERREFESNLKQPGTTLWCLHRTLMDVEPIKAYPAGKTISVVFDTDRNIDRWTSHTTTGATDADIKQNIVELWGKLDKSDLAVIPMLASDGVTGLCDVGLQLKNGVPAFHWNVVDGQAATILSGAKLVKAVRDIYQIPLPKKVKK